MFGSVYFAIGASILHRAALHLTPSFLFGVILELAVALESARHLSIAELTL